MQTGKIHSGPTHSGRVNTEGDNLYYEVRGQGQPLLMIPPAAGSVGLTSPAVGPPGRDPWISRLVPGAPLSGERLIHAPEGVAAMVAVSAGVGTAVLLGWEVTVGISVGTEFTVAGIWVEAARPGGSLLQAAKSIEKSTNKERAFRYRIPDLLEFKSARIDRQHSPACLLSARSSMKAGSSYVEPVSPVNPEVFEPPTFCRRAPGTKSSLP